MGNIVVVGLGNPGKKYELTRHNMGAIVVQGFAKLHQLEFKDEPKLRVRHVKALMAQQTVHLVLPLTYMNESGIAVRQYLDYFKLPFDVLVVISDDADLPFGELRLRASGSSGGHNGLKSIRQYIGSDSFVRLKVGIGRSANPGADLSDYVLDGFTAEQLELLPETVSRAVAFLNDRIEQKALIIRENNNP